MSDAKGFRYTPYSALQEGDEFIRMGGRPVLLRDIPGVREKGELVVIISGTRYSFPIFRMERTAGGWTRDVVVK